MVEEEKATLAFRQYNSIQNDTETSVEKYLDRNPDEFWVAMEKIHGSNFSFVTNGEEILHCRRKGALKANERFMGYEDVAKKLDPKFKQLFQELQKNEYPSLRRITIYGELYGGIYKGEESATGVKAIQLGIYYSPAIEFQTFDIHVEYEGFSMYMDYKLATKYLKALEIPYARVIYEGTLAELHAKLTALDLNHYESLVYLDHGLPKVEDNFLEGFVIKKNGPTEEDPGRPAIKIKSDHYKETVHNKTKGEVRTEMKAHRENQKLVKDRLLEYVTKNRYNNLVSKLSEAEVKDTSFCASEVIKDAWEDMTKEEDPDFVTLAAKFKKPAMKAMRVRALEIISDS